MKKFIIFLLIMFIGAISNATNLNELHTVVLEGSDEGYNIVLNSDVEPIVKKTTKGSDFMKLTLTGVSASETLNAVYRGSIDINSLIIETVSSNEIKIYIEAKNIANATILSKSANGSLNIISERFPIEKVVWSVCALVILGLLFRSAKSITDYENSIVIKKDIKDREIELYRNFQKELDNMPKINSKIKNAYATNIMPRSRRNYKELARR